MTTPTTSWSEQEFSSRDFELILANTFIERVDYCKELDSTNSRAARLAAESPIDDSRVLVLTDCQTAGRGRGSNRWWSDRGSLTFSVLFRPGSFLLPASLWPQMSLTTGLAVCNAIESLCGELKPRIKWPNDVYLHGRKICGILVEAAEGQQGNLIVGVGINVLNSASQAPADLRDKVIALSDATSAKQSRVNVLLAILHHLGTRLERLTSNSETLRTEWSQRCLLTGRPIEIEIHTNRIAGICLGIDDEGALLVKTNSEVKRCLSGVVTKID